jgi:DNA-3-methyladenine glycosylase
MRAPSRAFFARPAPTVAKELLGMTLVHESPEGTTAGRIVETEAYDEDDPASHAFGGKRVRNAAMFGPAGHAYVYFTYGMHHCFNVVAGPVGRGEAVLIRALEPVEGASLMRTRRGVESERALCSGPAKLVVAMGITKGHYGADLLRGPLRIARGTPPRRIARATRVGITKATGKRWRFYDADSTYVSRK